MWFQHTVMCPKDVDRMANQTSLLLKDRSDVGLHRLPKAVCPYVWEHLGTTGTSYIYMY